MDRLEDFVADLVPVSEWVWWLFRITYRDDLGNTRVRFLVSTDAHLDEEVQRRWPGEHMSSYTWDIMARAKQPRQLWCGVLGRQYPEDPWDAGKRLADELRLDCDSPIPEEFMEMD